MNEIIIVWRLWAIDSLSNMLVPTASFLYLFLFPKEHFHDYFCLALRCFVHRKPLRAARRPASPLMAPPVAPAAAPTWAPFLASPNMAPTTAPLTAPPAAPTAAPLTTCPLYDIH